MPSDADTASGSETTCYLVRHAHAVWQLDEQHPLSPRGQADAERVADVLEGGGITAIYASPYPRAVQTVEPLAARLGLEVQIEPDLRERKLSLRREPDFEAAVARAWRHPDTALPGAESNTDALRRVRGVMARLAGAHDGQTVAVTTHGSLMAILLHALDPSFGLDAWARMTMPDVFRLSGNHVERVWTP